jgi:LysM repeat protein
VPKPLRIAILGVVAVIVLWGAVVLGMNLSQGRVTPDLLPAFTPTVTNTPTQTSTPTQTATPTATPLPTETPTPIPPIEYTVKSGDTLLDIAMAFGLSVDELTQYNGLESDMIREGQTMLIPPPTPTPGPTPTPEPIDPNATIAPYILHTVRAGETLSTIAEQYPGVSVNDIRIASQLSANSETINVNQVLTIPRFTPTPPPEIVGNGGTPTPTPGLMRYPAPQMLHPRNGADFHGPDAVIALQWSSVGILDAREYYQVELIVPTGGEKKTIQAFMKSTVWRVPAELFPPETVEDRTFSWRVVVVRQVILDSDPNRIISSAGRRRTFTWELK